MHFKLLTLNIWQGNLLNEAIAFLKEEKPDILLLQEVYEDPDKSLPEQFRTYSIVKERLAFLHAAFAPTAKHVRAEGTIEQGNAIFSRFPILKTDVTFYGLPYRDDYRDIPQNYEDHPRNLQHAAIDCGGTKLNIFNTHGIWGTHGKDTEARLKMCDVIVREVRGKSNVILAGDFNFFRHTQGIGRIEQELVNVFGDELNTSFNVKRKTTGNYAKSVVDMLFASKDLKILKHYCPAVDVSDHLPLAGIFATM